MKIKSILKNMWLTVSAMRLVPHIILFELHPVRGYIRSDLERWSLENLKREMPATTFGEIWTFIKLMTLFPEYRNLFYYRVGWITRVLYPLCRPMPLLHLSKVDEGIGPGFVIKHGRASSVGAKRIGKNFMIFQHVAIGYTNETDKPTFGDNVTVYAGAKILGNVVVGNNVKIGANAVVLKDVPDDCTVVGVPAYIVRRNGKKVREDL